MTTDKDVNFKQMDVGCDGSNSSQSVYTQDSDKINVINSSEVTENDSEMDSTSNSIADKTRTENEMGSEQISSQDANMDVINGASHSDVSMNCISQLANMDITSDEGGCSSENDLETLKINMLTRLSHCDAHFKSQQRGEPDLTDIEKYQIGEDILNKNPARFLSQFQNYLIVTDLNYFSQFKGQYEVDFYLNQIQKHLDKGSSAKVVKNRRYAAMLGLIAGGDYFSEEEMKYRDPLLYEQMIGNYLTDDEIQNRVDKTDLRFSTILLKHIDQIEENKLYYSQKETEEADQAEGEEQCEEDEVEEDEESEIESEEDDGKPKISANEKEQLKTEFLSIMQEKYLTGQDEDFFDYKTVDNNCDYDSLKTIEQDEQDKYFDEEDGFD